MGRFACLWIPDVPLAAALRAEPELHGRPVAIAEAADARASIVGGTLRGLTVAQARTARADLVVLVTEPTPFGLHDLVLAVEMTRALEKPVTAVVNRSDLGDDHTRQYLASQEIEVAAEIPFRPEVAEAYAHGEIAAAASHELCSLLLPLKRHLIAEAAP